METRYTLEGNALNYSYKMKHGITKEDIEEVNFTINLIEYSRNKEIPIFGDEIKVISPDEKVCYAHAHLDSPIETEFASICVQPMAAPFIFHDGAKITKCSCSGGYWTREQELEMYVYQGYVNKLFCQWGHSGMAHSGAIYFSAIVNYWELRKEGIY